ncbi:MAG TPA: DUF6062 family protein [Puia sp.]|nr:DUF6062 family protein [Puia sp.]
MIRGLEIEPDLKDLRAYTRAKQALAGQLRQVRRGLEALGRKEALEQCAALMVKLAEDRFTLAVLGQFNRGKSSLMNAIIGQELLPTGVLPLTSAITVLRYGPSPQLVVTRSGMSFPEMRPLEELAEFVTENGNPGNRRKVQTVRVELPVPFLRYGIEFVDTPGIGSAVAANTTTTYDFLPACDAVLFVTAADSPLSEAELAFLADIRPHVGKIFFVVNKIDLLASSERAEVGAYVQKTLQGVTGDGDLRVYPVSSREGLRSRLTGDEGLYTSSGLLSLEEDLGAFLSKEKSAAFLAVVAQKARRIVDLEEEAGAFEEAALATRAVEIRKDKVRVMQQEPHAAALTIRGARRQLAAWEQKAEETGGTDAGTETIPEEEIPRERPTPEVSPAGSGDHREEELGVRTCPVCAHVGDKAQDFLINWQYELSVLEAAQDRFADELGFCPLHTWQLVSISSPYGASVGYPRLVERLAVWLKQTETGDEGKLARLVRNTQTCRVCDLLRQGEQEYIGWLAGRLAEEGGQAAYRHSEGVCLRHLSMLITAVDQPELRTFLLSDAAGRFSRDVEDMRSYALKRDALRRFLQNSNEEDAYYRAMIRFVGDRRVCMPWPEDGEI